MSTVKTVTDASFNSEILQTEKPVLVAFTASVPGQAEAISCLWTQMAEQRDDIEFAIMDVGNNPHTQELQNTATREAYGVEVCPSLYLFRNGQVANIALGGKNAQFLSDWIDESLAKPEADDMSATQAKEFASEALKNAMKKFTQLIAKVEIASSSLKTAGAAMLFATNPVFATCAIGSFVATDNVSNIVDKLRNKTRPEPTKTGAKFLRSVFNAATLAGGIMLMAAPTSGFIAGAAAIGIGAYMTVTGGISTMRSLKALFTKAQSGPPQQPPQEAETIPPRQIGPK